MWTYGTEWLISSYVTTLYFDASWINILYNSAWLILHRICTFIWLQLKGRKIQGRGNVKVWMKKDVYFYTTKRKRDNVNNKNCILLADWRSESVQNRYINIYKCNNDHIFSRFNVFTLDYIENRWLTASLPKTKNLRLKNYGII